jgi:hypothetical protein
MQAIDLSKPGEKKKLIWAGALGLAAILVVVVGLRRVWRQQQSEHDRQNNGSARADACANTAGRYSSE